MKKESYFFILFLVLTILLIGLFGLSILIFKIFIKSNILTYIFLIITAFIIGFLNYTLVQKITKDNNLITLTGIIAPIFAILVLFIVFGTFLEPHVRYETGLPNSDRLGKISLIELGMPGINAFWTTILFFISFNIPFIYYLNKQEESTTKYLLWYLLVPILFLIVWLIASPISNYISEKFFMIFEKKF